MKPNKKVVAAGHICLDISPVFPESCRGEVHKILVPGKNGEEYTSGGGGTAALSLVTVGDVEEAVKHVTAGGASD